MRSRLNRLWTIVWAWAAFLIVGYSQFAPEAEAATPVGTPPVSAALGQTIPWIEGC
jgi:hypothetical protein